MADISKIQLPSGTTYNIKDSTAHYYGVCSTAAMVPAKVVYIDGFTSESLVTGVHITVQFTNKNNNTAQTLNVSSTGAKEIRMRTDKAPHKNDWFAGQIIEFVYDGTYWVTLSTPLDEGKVWYSVCLTAADTQEKSINPVGFDNVNMIDGATVVVAFEYGNTAANPTLRVGSATNVYPIYRDVSHAIGVWDAGAVFTLTLVSGKWVVSGGQHANTNAYGLTKLSNSISTDESSALTPKAVYDLEYALVYGENTIGNAVIGTATTSTPNYTPSGEIELTTSNITIVDGLDLSYSYINSKLYLELNTSTATIQIPTGAAFKGNGVNFEIERKEEE